MAATTKTGLWQLAATVMGATYATEIVDADSPSTAIEKTMEQVYDQIRVGLLRRADWQFARRYARLRQAPKTDPKAVRDQTITWDPSGRFEYVYREPADSIKFRGFQRDWSDTNLITNHVLRRLPIQYVTYSAAENGGAGSGVYLVYSSSYYLYGGGSVWVDFTDDTLIEHALRDEPDGTEFDLVTEAGLPLGSLVANRGYYGFPVTSWLFDINYTGVTYTTNPSTMDLVLAVRPATSANWVDHIFANASPDTYGVYTVDITDVSEMPYDFQMVLASELAFQTAIVHSKSTKQLQVIENRAARYFSDAVSSFASEEESLTRNTIPTAEQARY